MSTPCGGGVGRGEWWWGGGAAEGAAAATGVTSAKGAGGAGGATGGEGPGGGGGEGGGEGAEGCGGVRRAQICSSSRRSRHSRCSRRCVPRLASVSCSSMQRGSSSAAGRPSSYCSQSASCERLATAPHAAPARPRRGRRAWDRCAECRRSLSTSKRRGGYYRAQRVAAGKQVALLSGVHTSARAHKPRDAGLSPSAGTSLLKQSAGARRAVSVLVPLSEGSARAEQWEPSSVTASAVACI